MMILLNETETDPLWRRRNAQTWKASCLRRKRLLCYWNGFNSKSETLESIDLNKSCLYALFVCDALAVQKNPETLRNCNRNKTSRRQEKISGERQYQSLRITLFGLDCIFSARPSHFRRISGLLEQRTRVLEHQKAGFRRYLIHETRATGTWINFLVNYLRCR